MRRLLFGFIVLLLFGGCKEYQKRQDARIENKKKERIEAWNIKKSKCPVFEIKDVYQTKIGDIAYFDKYGQPAEVINDETIRAKKIKGRRSISYDHDYVDTFKTTDGHFIRLHGDREVVVLASYCNEYIINSK